MNTAPLVYIILVNYKNWQDTAECLESVFKLRYSNFRVVVVDNASENGSIEKLENWADGEYAVAFERGFYDIAAVAAAPVSKPLPYMSLSARHIEGAIPDDRQLFLVKSDKNLGFAGGNNVGIELALSHGADYVWLLNNDTVVAADTLTQLHLCFVGELHKGRQLGMLGAKLLYFHDPTLVQAILGRYKPMLASTEHIGFGQPATHTFEGLTIQENDYVVGASIFVSSAFVKEVGNMTEDYFLYFEEIDWAKRGQLKHYEINTCLQAKVYHKEGASIGGGLKDNSNKSELSDFYSIRNRLIITSKYYRKYLLPVYLSLIFVVANRIRRKQLNRIPLIIKAFKSYYRRTS